MFINGTWCYLYRAIDRDGNLIDSMLSETRDMDAAKRFFRQAQTVTGQTPELLTTDGHTSYPRAIRETLGEQVEHRCNQYLNNHLEQDHRGIKQRYYPMRAGRAHLILRHFLHFTTKKVNSTYSTPHFRRKTEKGFTERPSHYRVSGE
jgi:transposase-like protein